MGQIAASMAGFDKLKQDLEDLKTAAQLLRGVNGQLEGKSEMINDGFNKLVEAKTMIDSQVGSAFNSVDQISGVTQNLLTKLTSMDNELEDLKKKAGLAQAAMSAGKNFKEGNIAGGLNDLKQNGIGGFTGGFGF